MMKKLNNRLLSISVIALILTVANGFILLYIKDTLHNGTPPEWVGGIVAILLITIGLCSLLNLFGTFLQFRHFKNESILRSAIFVLGIFSLFLIAVEATMLQDIGHEYMLSGDISDEWHIVFGGHSIQGFFYLLMILHCVQLNQKAQQASETPIIVMDESTFLTVHQVGIFSALLGFFCIIALKLLGVSAPYLDGLLLFSSIVALFPYGLAVVYWLYTKRKVKPVNWYDEKQFIDLSRGALITLVISVLIMTGLFIATTTNVLPMNMAVSFSIYLCATLLTFSVSNVIIAHN